MWRGRLNVCIAIFYLFIYFRYIYKLLDKSENKSPPRGTAKDWFASQKRNGVWI